MSLKVLIINLQGFENLAGDVKVLKKQEALALIEVEILFCRGSAEKIEADSRN